MQLTNHQIEQYNKATTGRIGILTGKPGTGKTTLVAEVIKKIKGRRLAVAGPTGKSAVRITESLMKAGVTDIKAYTIHSLLKWKPDGGFEHCEENPLKLDFLFIDESSMLSTGLMASLLEAVPDNCHVLFVGDPGQLSPVEHGAPLRDMIAAGLPCGTLTEIQRQAATSRIVRACHAIADNGTFEPSPKLDLANGENLLHIEKSSPESQIECLKEILERIRSRGEYDVVRDVQVLVAINKKSLLAREPINKMMQGYLNAAGEQVTGNKFRVGDKIICLKNGQAIVEQPPVVQIDISKFRRLNK